MKTKESRAKIIRMKTYPGNFVTVNTEGEHFGLRFGDVVSDMLGCDGEPAIVIGFDTEGKTPKVWILNNPSGGICDVCRKEEIIKQNLLLEERPIQKPRNAKDIRNLLRRFRRVHGYD